MMMRKRNARSRRGVVLAEAAVVYPVFLLFLLGTLVLGLGVFRYGQLSSLAWEGARWASVRGPDYQNPGPDFKRKQTLAAPTDEDVLLNMDEKMLFGLGRVQSGTVLTRDPGKTTVALGYDWRPEYNPPVGGQELDEATGEVEQVFQPTTHLNGAAVMPTLYFQVGQP